MITTWEEYRKNYIDLLENGVIPPELQKMVNPESEPKFIINADTREIKIPSAFEKGVAVYKDYKSETLFFEIDRYFDDVDFSSKRCCVQIINAENQQTALPMNYKYLSEDGKKLILGWTLTQEVSVKEGQVTFSIRFFSLDENGQSLDYSWSTRPATINVYKGLYITEGSATIPSKTTLEELLDQIEKIWHNNGISLDYNTLDNVPTILGQQVRGPIDNLILTLVTGEGSGSKFLTINDVLETLLIPGDPKGKYPVSNDALYTKFENVDTSLSDLEDAIDQIQSELGDMTFVPITIESFTIHPIDINGSVKGNPALVENGSVVSKILFKWVLSKDPTSLKINEESVVSPKASQSFTKTFSTPITTTQTFTISVSDKRGDPVTTTADLVFCNNTYWSVRGLTDADSIDQAFLFDYLTGEKLTPQSGFEISVNISDGSYLYVAIPKSIGKSFSFFFDGSALSGGMTFIKDMTLTRRNNYQTEYKIYRSTNSGLGQRTIRIE